MRLELSSECPTSRPQSKAGECRLPSSHRIERLLGLRQILKETFVFNFLSLSNVVSYVRPWPRWASTCPANVLHTASEVQSANADYSLRNVLRGYCDFIYYYYYYFFFGRKILFSKICCRSPQCIPEMKWKCIHDLNMYSGDETVFVTWKCIRELKMSSWHENVFRKWQCLQEMKMYYWHKNVLLQWSCIKELNLY